MDKKNQTGLFKLIEGLNPVDPKALAAFEREMTEETIPAMLRDAEKRRLLAAESRQRQLEMPTPENPEPAE